MGQFHCGVVTTYALQVGVAADCDNRDQSLSAFLAARCSIHEMILPDYPNPEREPLFQDVTAERAPSSLLVRMHGKQNGPRVEIWGRSERRPTKGRGLRRSGTHIN
jgi:hypothetical protein